MTSEHPLAAIVAQQLRKLGVSDEDLAAMSTSTLRDGDQEVAQVFRAGGMVALWDAARNELRYFNGRAELLLIQRDPLPAFPPPQPMQLPPASSPAK